MLISKKDLFRNVLEGDKKRSMIYKKNSYVTGSMCDSKLKLSILAADEIVENAVTELMGDLGIDGIVAMEKYKAMWLIAKNSFLFYVYRAIFCNIYKLSVCSVNCFKL